MKKTHKIVPTPWVRRPRSCSTEREESKERVNEHASHGAGSFAPEYDSGADGPVAQTVPNAAGIWRCEVERGGFCWAQRERKTDNADIEQRRLKSLKTLEQAVGAEDLRRNERNGSFKAS